MVLIGLDFIRLPYPTLPKDPQINICITAALLTFSVINLQGVFIYT